MKKIITTLLVLFVLFGWFFIGFLLGTLLVTYNIPAEKDIEEDLLEYYPLLNDKIVVPTVYKLPENHTTYNFDNVKVTAYNNVPNQTDSTPNITASNRPVYEGSVALSRDFFKKGVRYGDLLYIDCIDSWHIVEDKMNARFTNRVDIFLFDTDLSKGINKDCNIQVISYDR